MKKMNCIDKETVVYENNKENTARYVLGERGKKTLYCLAINPNTATPDNLDRTSIKVRTIARNNGFDGWILINVFPIRSENVSSLPDLSNEKEIEKNLEAIRKHIPKGKVTIWAAFGNSIRTKPYLVDCLKGIAEGLSDHIIHWVATRVNVSGTPKHPLYERNEALLTEFDMESFLKNI